MNSLDATVAVIHAFHSEIEIEQKKKSKKWLAGKNGTREMVTSIWKVKEEKNKNLV